MRPFPERGKKSTALFREAPRNLTDSSKVTLFAVLQALDVALVVSAAAAATAAGAHAAGVPLTAEILRNAAVGGAVKSAAMASAGLVILMVPQITF
jgi:hypothetical protein